MPLLERFFLRSFRPYLWVFGAVLLLYGRTLSFELTYLDDNVWVLDYHWFLKNLANVFPSFTQPDLVSWCFYRPLLNISFMINAYVSEGALWSYHATNLAIHAINGSLVFVLIRDLGYSRGRALSLALIYVLHPTLVGAVAWIPGRTDSWMGMFFLISFIGFMRGVAEQNEGGVRSRRKRLAYMAVHLSALQASLLSKETAVMLPVLAVGYLVLIKGQRRFWRGNLAWGISWGVVMTAWLMLRTHALSTVPPVRLSDVFISIWQNLPSLVSYSGKVFWPAGLSVLPIARDTTALYGSAAILVVGCLLGFSRKKRVNYVLFGLGWFLVLLMPSLILSFLNHEYRLYLPLVGCLILVAETDLVQHWAQGRRGLGVSLVVLAVCAALSWRQSAFYQNRYAFWNNAVKTSPHSPLAHRNLGAMYFLDGKFDLAQKGFQKALDLNPYEYMAHNNLGLIAMEQGDFKKAEEEYKKEIAINPTYDLVYGNLGLLYYKQRRVQEALAAWEKAVALNPKNVSALQSLAAAYYNQGNYLRASEYYRRLKQMGIPLPYDIRRERLNL